MATPSTVTAPELSTEATVWPHDASSMNSII
jgi:hypothetical protein